MSDPIATAIFAAPVGSVSAVTSIDKEGTYLFFVAAEETRAPTGDQADSIKANAFSAWYTPLRAKYVIWQDPALVSTSTSGS